MSRGFFDDFVVGFELAAAKDVSAADHDRNFTAKLLGFVDLLGDVNHFFHADPSLARWAKAFARKFEKDAFVFSRHSLT